MKTLFNYYTVVRILLKYILSPAKKGKILYLLLLYLCTLQDTNFMTSLELAVRFGKTLIIREMDGVEPSLYPLLRKDLIAQGAHSIVFVCLNECLKIGIQFKSNSYFLIFFFLHNIKVWLMLMINF